ncbi:MAG: hypothetical protein ACJAYU_004200 [Bradymonadia bacterium]|jgi:hypothetical protein
MRCGESEVPLDLEIDRGQHFAALVCDVVNPTPALGDDRVCRWFTIDGDDYGHLFRPWNIWTGGVRVRLGVLLRVHFCTRITGVCWDVRRFHFLRRILGTRCERDANEQ